MIDPVTDVLISLKDMCKLLPGRNGKRLSVCTAWRWAMFGRRNHKLETVLVGGVRYTTENAIRNFVKATTLAAQPEAGPTVSSSSGADARGEAAERELDRRGI